MIRNERHRLVHAFRRAALLSLVANACNGSASATGDVDATTGTDATIGDGTTATVETDPSTEAAVEAANDATIDAAADATDDSDAIDETADASSDEAGETTDPYATGPCARSVADAGDEAGSALCSRYWNLPCGVPAGTVMLPDCTFKTSDCRALCDFPAPSCRVIGAACLDGGVVAETGPIEVFCDVCEIGGRRPERLRARNARGGRRDVGAYFASLAHLEAASVPAFRRMVCELRALGAPRPIVVATSTAARDEVRHARTITRLARRFGAQPTAPRVGRARRRSLEALALDNEIEGCVRETFAACLMRVQASRSTDVDVRRALAQIADDETDHSALSWAISRWARRTLSHEATARLDRARALEIERLRASVADVDAAIARATGLPTGEEQRRMIDALAATIWTA